MDLSCVLVGTQDAQENTLTLCLLFPTFYYANYSTDVTMDIYGNEYVLWRNYFGFRYNEAFSLSCFIVGLVASTSCNDEKTSFGVPCFRLVLSSHNYKTISAQSLGHLHALHDYGASLPRIFSFIQLYFVLYYILYCLSIFTLSTYYLPLLTLIHTHFFLRFRCTTESPNRLN